MLSRIFLCLGPTLLEIKKYWYLGSTLLEIDRYITEALIIKISAKVTRKLLRIVGRNLHLGICFGSSIHKKMMSILEKATISWGLIFPIQSWKKLLSI